MKTPLTKVGQAAYYPIWLSLLGPVLVIIPNVLLSVDRDGWFVQMLLEHDATLLTMSVAVLTLVTVTLTHMSDRKKIDPVVQFAIVMGFLMTLLGGAASMWDDKAPVLGSKEQHWWLIAIVTLLTLPSLLALWWLDSKLKKLCEARIVQLPTENGTQN